MPFGKELILDMANIKTDMKLSNDVAYLRMFIRDLCDTVGMKRWGRAKFQRLTEPDHLSGTSFVQFIHTSSLVGHICDKNKTLYLNLFSCKDFSWEDVVVVVSRYFGGAIVHMQEVVRDAENPTSTFERPLYEGEVPPPCDNPQEEEWRKRTRSMMGIR